MMSLRALRSGARLSAVRPAARGFATVSEDAPKVASSLYDQKVDMSVIEQGKGYYINYKKMSENLDIVRQR